MAESTDNLAQVVSLLSENVVGKIQSSKEGTKRIDYFVKNISLLESLVNSGFDPASIRNIVRFDDWENRLGRIIEDYEKVLKPLGFNISQVTKMLHSDWEEKLDWIKDKYALVLGENRFTVNQSVMMLRLNYWKELVKWIEIDFNKDKHSTKDVIAAITSKDWRRGLEPPKELGQIMVDYGMIVQIYIGAPESYPTVAEAFSHVLNEQYSGYISKFSRDNAYPISRAGLFVKLNKLGVHEENGVYVVEPQTTKKYAEERKLDYEHLLQARKISHGKRLQK